MHLDLADRPRRATAPNMDRSKDILTPEALAFVAGLHRPLRRPARQERSLRASSGKRRFDGGARFQAFLPDTASSAPATGMSRRARADLHGPPLEITPGRPDRKMVDQRAQIGPGVLADSRVRYRVRTGQVWSRASISTLLARSLAFEDPVSGKTYALGATPAVLRCRPRAGTSTSAMSASAGRLFDFETIYLLAQRPSGDRGRSFPYFYPHSKPS